MAAKKPVKKAAPKKSMPKKGDEPVRAGRALSGVKGQKTKVDKYKQGLKNSSMSSYNRTQYNYDYGGPEAVAEKRDSSGFGKTKSYYRINQYKQPGLYGTSAGGSHSSPAKQYSLPKTTDTVMRQEALRVKAAKAKAKKKK